MSAAKGLLVNRKGGGLLFQYYQFVKGSATRSFTYTLITAYMADCANKEDQAHCRNIH
jgi:hypothetical protein